MLKYCLRRIEALLVRAYAYLILLQMKIILKYFTYKVNAEELLKDEKSSSSKNEQLENIEFPESKDDEKRERLSAIVAGGNSKKYLGKDLQLSDIDTMSNEEINKLYCRYEARLGASMTKTIGNSIINLYVMGVSKYFNIIEPPKLIQDLKEDPFINHALTSTCCELYYKYGMYLAPFTAMLTTARHIDLDSDMKIIKPNDQDTEILQ